MRGNKSNSPNADPRPAFLIVKIRTPSCITFEHRACLLPLFTYSCLTDVILPFLCSRFAIVVYSSLPSQRADEVAIRSYLSYLCNVVSQILFSILNLMMFWYHRKVNVQANHDTEVCIIEETEKKLLLFTLISKGKDNEE